MDKVPLNELFTLRGRFFNRSKRKHVLKRVEINHYEVNHQRLLLVILARFLRILKGFILENRVPILPILPNEVTDFSKKNF